MAWTPDGCVLALAVAPFDSVSNSLRKRSPESLNHGSSVRVLIDSPSSRAVPKPIRGPNIRWSLHREENASAAGLTGCERHSDISFYTIRTLRPINSTPGGGE